MNRLFPLVIASLVSALAAVVLTLVFAGEVLESLPDEGLDPVRDVAARLQTTEARLGRVERVVERELAATRRDVLAAIRSQTSAEKPDRVSPGRESPGSGAESPHVARDTPGPIGVKNLAALSAVAGWKTDEDVRAHWLFASERATLEAFGAPDEVAARGQLELWNYWSVEGDKIVSEYRLQLNNGRLVDASLVSWRVPRDVPTAQR